MAPSSAERPVASGSAASRLRPGRGGRRPRRRVAALGLAAAAAARPLAASALAPAQRAPCPSSPGRPPHPPAACEWRPRLRLRRPRPPRRPRRPLAAPAQARARRAVKSARPPLQPPRPLHPRRRPRGAVARRRSFWSIAACVANVCGLSGNLDCCPACIRPVVPAWVPPHPPQRIIRGMAAQRATALVSAGWPGAPPPPRSLCSGLRLCESLGGLVIYWGTDSASAMRMAWSGPKIQSVIGDGEGRDNVKEEECGLGFEWEA